MTVPQNISNYAGEHSSPLRVGNNLSVVPQNYIKIDGRAWKPAPTTGRRGRRPVSPPSQREVAFAAGKRRRERNGKISPPVKCCAFDSPLVRGGGNGGRTQFAPTSREQPPCCSAKLHQNLRAGVETRPYNGSTSRRPLRSHYSLPVP